MEERRKFELPGTGLRCGGCGEFLPHVDRTKETEGFVNRERRCPGCGQINVTDERVIHTRPVRAKRVTLRREDYL